MYVIFFFRPLIVVSTFFPFKKAFTTFQPPLYTHQTSLLLQSSSSLPNHKYPTLHSENQPRQSKPNTHQNATTYHRSPSNTHAMLSIPHPSLPRRWQITHRSFPQPTDVLPTGKPPCLQPPDDADLRGAARGSTKRGRTSGRTFRGLLCEKPRQHSLHLKEAVGFCFALSGPQGTEEGVCEGTV